MTIQEATGRGALYGGGAGFLASALISFFREKNRKKGILRRLLSATGSGALGALGGAALGAVGGRVYQANKEYNAYREQALEPLSEGRIQPRAGSVYYISYPRNRFDLKFTDIPKERLAEIKKYTGWSGSGNVGHAGLVTVDENGNGRTWNYGLYDGNGGPQTFATDIGNVKGLKPSEIARLIIKHYNGGDWGDKAEVWGTKVPDIGVAERYMKNVGEDQNGSGFSFVPGGNSCGSVARSAFDAARQGTCGPKYHWLDLLWGGFPGANAPTLGTNYGVYDGGSDTNNQENAK